jgi:type IV secretion system protein VirB1
MDFVAIAQECAPNIAPQTLLAVARVESSFNPYAIGVVGGRLERQPRNHAEAVATARNLERLGFNFSLGATQVNRYNLAGYNETYESIFDVCRNFRTGAAILEDCFVRAKRRYPDDRAALRAAFSCYYSGNYVTGFQHGYVQKVVAAAGSAQPIPVVPNIVPAAAASTKGTGVPQAGRKEDGDVVELNAKDRRGARKVIPVVDRPTAAPGHSARGTLKYDGTETADETDGD